ncbi:MAG TPA: WYL domain-containing protein [Acidimicrobiales bacterium]|nr:WYL domain-containing protein [Acidimicrobiales bacterium]
MARSSSNFAPRLRRMLLMVPWLLESGGSTVAELAARFGVGEDDVIRDLNLVMCCGIPPYGAEHMITVMLDDDGSVLAWKGPFLNRPMRLTPTEGFAVLAAGRTLLAVPGAPVAGALASALDKLEAALGSSPEGGGRSVDVDLEAPPLLGVVRSAAADSERLGVAHWSAWRDEVTERVIDPLLVFSSDGRWYVSAVDSRSGEVRHFRVDRFASAAPTGERFTPPPGAPTAPPSSVFSGADSVEVTLRLPDAARWVAEAYEPLEVAVLEDGTGHFRIRLAVAGERWLERLLLRVGPEAVVEAPTEWQDVGPAAARRLLARYS